MREILKKISRIIEKSSYKNNEKEILEWLEDEALMVYFINRLSEEKLSDLGKIDFIIEEMIKKGKTFSVFQILRKNMSEKNGQFILDFLFDKFPNAKEKETPKVDDFIGEAINILDKIIRQQPEKIESVYLLVRLILRVHQKYFRELRSVRSHEKQIVAILLQKIYFEYKKQKYSERIDEVIGLIDLGFDLVNDQSDMFMYTPDHIFEILEDYVRLDFENNFKKVFEIILIQFKSGSSHFAGWEGFGGGISQSGKSYKLNDRTFVRKTLSPALGKFYSESQNKQKAWEYIKECCVARKVEDISNRKPDFLSRSAIEVIFDRYKNCKGNNKKEAFEILRDFIKMERGIPDKLGLVFQKLKEADITFNEKWKFVKISQNLRWNKNKLPANIFVEQLVADLAKENFKPAINLQKKWIETREQTKKRSGFMDDYTVEGIKSLLQGKETRKEGLKMFKSYVSKDIFKKSLERFDVFDVTQTLGGILDSDFEFGLGILKEISSKNKLTENEQMLVCNSIGKVSNGEILLRTYNEFLSPFFGKFDDNVGKIEKKIDNSHVREGIVDFGDALARAGHFKEALRIAKIFINDKDPIIENEKDDPKGKWNLHTKAKKGDDSNSITSVRGKVCWLLHEFPVLGGRDFIPKIVPLVKKLTEDKNYYVRGQSTVPLAELVRVRNTVLPKYPTKWFLDRDVSKEIEEISFAMLRKKENQKIKSIMIGLAHVFQYMRSLDEEPAHEMLSIFRKSKFEEANKMMMSTFLFYAEFRKNAFQGDLWKSLEPFDDGATKELLINFLRNGTTDDRDNFAWQFNDLIRESKGNNSRLEFNKAFNISIRYLKIISEIYEPQSYHDIYRFISENIGEKYEECLSFFKACLAKEKKGLVTAEKKGEPIDRTWISDHYYDEVLSQIVQLNKKEDFIDVLKAMSTLPGGGYIYHSSGKAIEYLKSFPKDNKDVEKIFDNLIKKQPLFYDQKAEWLNR